MLTGTTGSGPGGRTPHVGPGEDNEGGLVAAQLHIIGDECGARAHVQARRGVPQALSDENLRR